MALRLKISRKGKPYCQCLECGIQIFFRGQAGITRLHKLIRSEEAVAAEFDGPARAISLFNRLQGLKRQRDSLEKKQGFFSWDEDRQNVIKALDREIDAVSSELERETKAEKKK